MSSRRTSDPAQALCQSEAILNSISLAISVNGIENRKYATNHRMAFPKLEFSFHSCCYRDLHLLDIGISQLDKEVALETKRNLIQARIKRLMEPIRSELPNITPEPGPSPFTLLARKDVHRLLLEKERTHATVTAFLQELERRWFKMFQPATNTQHSLTPKMVGIILLPRPEQDALESDHVVAASTMPEIGKKSSFGSFIQNYEGIVPQGFQDELLKYQTRLNTKYCAKLEAMDEEKKEAKRQAKEKVEKEAMERGMKVANEAKSNEATKKAINTARKQRKMVKKDVNHKRSEQEKPACDRDEHWKGIIRKAVKDELPSLFDPLTEAKLHAFAYSVDQNKCRDGCFRCQCLYQFCNWYGGWTDASRIAEWHQYRIRNTFCWETYALAQERKRVFKDMENI